MGAQVGKLVGPLVSPEKRTVKVADGTNADEVIANTQQVVRERARTAVAEVFQILDRTLFEQLDAELAELEAEVARWPRALEE
jgi:hypothetical protein